MFASTYKNIPAHPQSYPQDGWYFLIGYGFLFIIIKGLIYFIAS
ncbi:hypothetical protein Loa_00081 [Legionella oakridgensis ATCC 33761 = DSM 21215]|uniref:Uncharacterized protein n=1 Tax=Legionella oakridgensis ATCC 33761 = DSM 21215 TaxID=1268635 RepID=W0BAM2_9GAMM|nr:hypothetical protein Loa_00081 [Legionella oakridgensis ATCC 33761 = DSM 21215]STY15620.1 Uncharacterised protein [Legionella longbeachae]